jgi:hypothetical protein
VLVADKGYDDRKHRQRLRTAGKRPLIKHREFAPYDKAANARMDEALYHRRSLVETVIAASFLSIHPTGAEAVLKRKYGAKVKPGMVAAVSGVSGDVPGLQRGAGSEGRDSSSCFAHPLANHPSSKGFLQSWNELKLKVWLYNLWVTLGSEPAAA